MPGPHPSTFYRKINDVQEMFGGLTQTSQFMVQLGLYGNFVSSVGVENHLRDANVFDERNGTADYNFLCSEATLPGSTFDVMELSGARQGVIERMPTRRVYTDFDLTFYIDSRYKVLRLFEEWMNYIDPLINNDGAYAGDPQGQTGFGDRNCYYRFQYPNYYKRPIAIHKFERNLLKPRGMNRRSGDVKDKTAVLSYIFLDAFPLNVQAIPFSYQGTDITKVTINFSYTRYLVNRNSGIGKGASAVAKDAAVAGNFSGSFFDEVFVNNYIESGEIWTNNILGESFSNDYSMKFDGIDNSAIWNIENTDFRFTDLGLGSFSDSVTRENFNINTSGIDFSSAFR